MVSSRLFAHSDDPDIDDPYQAPAGHTLGGDTGSADTAQPITESAETAQPMEGQETSEPPTQESTAGGDNGEQPQLAKSLKCDE